MASTPAAPAAARGGAAQSFEAGPSTSPERNMRQNMELGGLCKGGIRAKSQGEKVVVSMGRQEIRRREELPAAEREAAVHAEETWKDDLVVYAAVSHIEPGDTMNYVPGNPPKGGIPIRYKGREFTITHTDVPNESGVTVLRVAESPDPIPLTDCLEDISRGALIKLDKATPEEAATPEARIARSFFEGKDPNPQEIREVARKMGYVTPAEILEISKGITGPDGKPILTEHDIKVLSGEEVETPPPTPPDAETDSAPKTEPELSEKAKEIQKIFRGEPFLEADQVKDALFALGIPTDSTQLRDVLRDSQHELEQLQGDLSGFTHQGEVEQLAKKHAMETRIAELKLKVEGYGKLKEDLIENTGSDAFDTVAGYYDVLQNGKGDAEFLDLFVTAIRKPTVENISRFDDSYMRRCGEHADENYRKTRKQFLKKLVMGAAAGVGALVALNIYKATKKDEK